MTDQPGRVRGVFPGGPRRGGGSAERGAPPSVSELSGRAARTKGARRRRRRRRRTMWTVVGVMALSAGIGVALGRYAHDPTEAPRSPQSNAVDRAVSREVNRVLLELWKMEEGEMGRGGLR